MPRHTLDKILSKPSDYSICLFCETLNWYENELCHECGSNNLHRDITDEEMDAIIKDIAETWIDEDVPENEWDKEYDTIEIYV